MRSAALAPSEVEPSAVESSVPSIGVSAVEAARLLGVSRREIYVLVASGRLRGFRVGRRVIALRAGLDEFVQKNRLGGES